MSDPPPGFVLITYSTGRVGGEPAIGPGRNSPAGFAAGEAAATGPAAGEAAATGLAPGEAARAGLAAGEAAAGLLSAGFAAGADVGVGTEGLGGVGAAPGAQATVRTDTTMIRATLDRERDHLIGPGVLLVCEWHLPGLNRATLKGACV